MPFDFGPLWLSIELAAITVAILMLVGTPVAWWLARTRSRLRVAVEAVVALPLVLPPPFSASTSSSCSGRADRSAGSSYP